MTETTLDQVLIDAIQKTQAGVGEAVDFAVSQAPDVIHQLMIWKFTESILVFMLGVVSIWFNIRLFKYASKKPPVGEDSGFGGG